MNVAFGGGGGGRGGGGSAATGSTESSSEDLNAFPYEVGMMPDTGMVWTTTPQPPYGMLKKSAEVVEKEILYL
ncbi:unnamed protein product [Linum trigynum]|uniref:Uncharacterized protein n=1 Tax=Linum trigynum TaxID=586398 RepID=A0AAV2GKB6_9ROSI